MLGNQGKNFAIRMFSPELFVIRLGKKDATPVLSCVEFRATASACGSSPPVVS